MKTNYLLATLSLLFFLTACQSGSTTKSNEPVMEGGKCKLSVPVAAILHVGSRGEEDDPFVPGEGVILTEGLPRGGDSGCLFSIKNESSLSVNIYLDTVWQGLVEPKKNADILIDKGGYEFVHAFSVDNEFKWVKSGDCSCERTFELKQPDVSRIRTTDES